MGKSQIIHTDGEDLVVITRSDYEALLAPAGDDASEDAMTARIVEATGAKTARGEDVALRAAVWDAIESGEHPIRAIRKYRGLTQIDVAEQAGLRQGYIADIEAGKKTGSAKRLQPHLECRSTSSCDDTAVSTPSGRRWATGLPTKPRRSSAENNGAGTGTHRPLKGTPAHSGAPRSMKMGTTPSPSRCDI
jgi:DNA-binding XRE family transcriptional regulator